MAIIHPYNSARSKILIVTVACFQAQDHQNLQQGEIFHA